MNEVTKPGQKWYSPNLIRQAYRQVRDDYHNYAAQELNKPWWNTLLSGVQVDGLILELGCGTGVAAKYFSERGRRVIGIDISPEMIELARREVEKVPLLCADLEDIEFPENTLDGISAFFVFLHLPKEKTRTMIERTYRWLKPGGSLALSVVEGTDEGRCDNFMDKDCKVYLSYYEQEELKDMLSGAGFTIKETEVKHFEGEGFEETELFFIAIKQNKKSDN